MLTERQRGEDQYRRAHSLWFDAPSTASNSNKLIKERGDAMKSRDMHYQFGQMDWAGEIPTLTGKLKVDWIDFPVDDILDQLGTLKEAILRGVFRQKAAAAWFGVRADKAQVTVLLAGQVDATSWLEKIDIMSHSWPKSGIIGKVPDDRLQALRYHMYTDWPGIYSYDQLNDRLFINPGRNDNIDDTPSTAGYQSRAYWDWQCQQQAMQYCLGLLSH